MANSTNRKINIWINDKQVTNSYTGIRNAMRKARNELGQMTIGSKEYLAQTKKLKSLEKILNKHRKMQGMVARGWTKIKQEIKQIAVGNIIANAFTGMASKIGQAWDFVISKTGEAEQGITNVLTLLSDADVTKYSESLKQGSLEVQKLGFAQEDTNKALFDAVSAGIEAGDSIDFLHKSAVLAKGGVTDLGTATDGMTTIMNAYNLSMEEADNVMNGFFTAQKFGKTTVGELASNVGKSASIASMANMSYQELLATTALLTKKGISTDEAMTNIKGTLTALLKPGAEAEKMMRKLGIPVGATQLKAVGFTKTMEKLNEVAKKNPDLIAKIIPNVRGLSAVTALSGEGLEEYKEILNSVTNDIGENSSLQKAYQKQMETLPNIIAKAKGELTALAVNLGQKLAPVIKALIPLFSGMMKHIIQFIDFLVANKEAVKTFFKIVIVGTTALVSYNLAVKLSVLWTNRMRIATIKTMVQEKLQLVLTQGRRIAMLSLAAAQALFTGNTKKLSQAMRLLNLTMKANPIGLLVAGITAAVVAYKLFIAESDKMTVAMKVEKDMRKEIGKAIIKEKTELNLLLGIARDEKRSKEDRLKAVKKLNEISPEYLGNITLEKINTDETTASVRMYIKALEDKTRAQIAQQKLAEINTQIFEIEVRKQEEMAKIMKAFPVDKLTDVQTKQLKIAMQRRLEAYNKDIKDAEKYRDEYLKILDKLDINLIGSSQSGGGNDELICPTGYIKKNGKCVKITVEGGETSEDIYAKYLKIYENYVKEMESLNTKLYLQDKSDFEKQMIQATEHYNDMMQVTTSAISDLEAKQKTKKGLNDNEIALLKNFYQQQIDITELYERQILDIRQQEIRRIDALLMTSKEKELKAIDDKYSSLLDSAEEFSYRYVELQKKMQQEIDAINEKYAGKEDKRDPLGFTDSDYENLKDKVAKIAELANQLSSIWGYYDEARKNEEQARLDEFERTNDKKKRILQQRLNFGLISETEHTQAIAKLDRELDLEKKKIERDQAIRAKRQKTFEAVINTASAVVEALPNYVLAALVAVTGAAQIAAIQSEPIPAFAGGGRINKPTVGLVGEAGREIILSNSIVDDKNLGPIADDLARIQEGKTPNFLGEPAKPNFGGMTKAISGNPTMISQSSTTINQVDTQGMANLQNETSAMRNDIAEMTAVVKDMKYLKAIITQRELDERDTDKELLLRHTLF